MIEGVVSIIDYTDNLIDQFCGRRPHTIDTVNQVLEERCFSRERPDKDKLLSSLSLSMYNPLDIVRITHGVMFTDFYWLRFKGENLKWKDVNPRLNVF